MAHEGDRPRWVYRFLKSILIPVGVRTLSHLDVQGLERVPENGPLIIASNHVDNFDAGAIGWKTPRPYMRFMGRPEAFSEFLRGSFWRLGGVIPANGPGLATAIAVLRAGGTVVIYPEGVISPALVPARAGLGILAMRSRAVIVPVAVWGTEEIHVPQSFFRHTDVVIRYGDPVDAGDWPKGKDQAQALTDHVMLRIAGMLPPEYRGAYADTVADSAAPAAGGG